MSFNYDFSECYCDQCSGYYDPPEPPDPFDWCEEEKHAPYRADGTCWCYRTLHPAEFGAKLLEKQNLVYANSAPRFENVIWTYFGN